jgi:acyl carrier protein
VTARPPANRRPVRPRHAHAGGLISPDGQAVFPRATVLALTIMAALLGAAPGGLRPDAHFSDLGGDSLSALTFANLLREIFDIDMPVGVIISPATDLRGIADYIETQRQPGVNRPTFASVHGRVDRRRAHARRAALPRGRRRRAGAQPVASHQ